MSSPGFWFKTTLLFCLGKCLFPKNPLCITLPIPLFASSFRQRNGLSGRLQLSAFVLLLIGLTLSACAPGSSPSSTDDGIQHAARPGSPVYEQLISDCNTGDLLPDDGELIQPATGCDSWQINRYERPFNAETQDLFFPDLDILTAELGSDGTWFYARLTLFDADESSQALTGTYAIEFDLDFDGRGDVLVKARPPVEGAPEDWAVAGVQFLGDSDNDVGNQIPLAPDSPSLSDGFDTLVFDAGQGEDTDLAWARVLPGETPQLELAFKASALYDDPTFKWWAWSDLGIANPASADYHDTFEHPVAGDPIQGQQYFPAQAIYEVDNTCAQVWGVEPDDDPELCVNDSSLQPPLQFPPPTQTQTPSLTASATPTGPTSTSSDTLTPSSTLTASDTATPVTDTATPSETATPSRTASDTASPTLPVCETASPNRAAVTCTPTSTATPTSSSTDCTVAAATNNVRNTCTPTATSSPTPTPTPSPTECIAAAAATNNLRSTCTPTSTATRCITPNVAGQLVDCTPTPTATQTLCVQPALTAVLLVPCTPTSTPEECVTPGANGRLVNCTPTPTPTPTCAVQTFAAANLPCPSATPTVCNVHDNAGLPIPCTDTPAPSITPTQCSGFSPTTGLNLYCTDTPTATLTQTLTGTVVEMLVPATPIVLELITSTPAVLGDTATPAQFIDPTPIILELVTATPAEMNFPTPTPTECFVAFAFALVDCTPTITPTPTASSTACILPNVAGVPEYCTPTPVPSATPTYCAVPYPSTVGLYIQCTPTPETAALMVFPDQDTNCRQGPNPTSEPHDTLLQGEGIIPLGRTPDNLYFLFRGPVTSARCWAAAFLFTIPFGPLNLVPPEVLPYINYPTPTPTPTQASGSGPSATPVPAKPTATPIPQCSDGLDNDGDGGVDYNPTGRTGDRQCKDASDNNEAN